MSDLMKKDNRTKLALGAGGFVGGVAILALSSLVAHQIIPALIIGGLILYGSWRLFQKPKSSLVGMVGMAAGILAVAAGLPLVGGLAQLLLGLSGFGLVAGGIWTIFRVFQNRKS